MLGMYPGDPGPPGSDCSGVVMRVGRGVRDLQPGDEVFGLAHGCLGTVVVSPAATLATLPPNLSFTEAATVPTVFITVETALHQAAELQPGERVLVHAAAGGVGLAAIQVAQAAGATVLATAGGPSKRSLLHSLGVQEVLGSRDTVFVGEAAELGGVDVVLNSLTSSGMVAGSLAALNHSGRFVEISKRDIWSAARVAQGEIHATPCMNLLLSTCNASGCTSKFGHAVVLKPLSFQCRAPAPAERPDLGYSLVAVDFLAPPVIAATLHKISAQLTAGAITPLRQTTHALGSVASAFRQVIQASHVGKVVVSTEAAHPPAALSGQGYPAVAITGGSGGLGLMTTQWLVHRTGPLHAHLLSRSGRVADAAALAQLAATSACISSHMADAGVPADVDATLGQLPGPALSAVLHASGILQASCSCCVHAMRPPTRGELVVAMPPE